jgi:hypothetical protein
MTPFMSNLTALAFRIAPLVLSMNDSVLEERPQL